MSVPESEEQGVGVGGALLVPGDFTKKGTQARGQGEDWGIRTGK